MIWLGFVPEGDESVEFRRVSAFGNETIESILPAMNIALYVRISTADQNASMQEDELRAYCKRRALTVVGEYQDTISGAKDSRPALQQLLADACARKFDTIVVWKIDRFREVAPPTWSTP